jgi:hypothetical protein
VAVRGRQGFGRTLIEQGWRHDLDGEVALDFRPEGLVCGLCVPAAAAPAEPREPPSVAPPAGADPHSQQ